MVRWSDGDGETAMSPNLPSSTFSILFGLSMLTASLCGDPAHAEPLYLQRLLSAKPTAEQIAESEKLTREHKKLEYREKMRVPPFHKHMDRPMPKAEAFCQNCHGPLPHSAKLRTRAFMNMHTRFIACETCHFRPKDAKLDYRWQTAPGDPPASETKGRLRTGGEQDNAISFSGEAHIAPYFQGEAANLAQKDPAVQTYLERWKRGAFQDKALARAQIHAPLENKGPDCDQCHAEKQGMLDYAALGADEKQEQALRQHMIPRFFGHYAEKDEERRIRILDLTR
jgi:hypothetical protein